MTRIQYPQAAYDRIVMALASLAGGWALVAALLPWPGGRWLATLGAGYRPMSSTAAAAILALALALVLGRLRNRWAHGLSAGLAATTTLACLGILVAYSLGRQPAPALEPSGLRGILQFRMSPLASWSVLVLGLAAGLGASDPGASRRRRRWGAAAALAPLGLGQVALVTYATGAPLLYGTHTIPMSLPTAILTTLVAVLVLAAAGPDTWPGSPFVRSGPEADLLTSRRGPALVFLALALAILAGGTLILRGYLRAARTLVQEELAAIADIRAGQVSDWYSMWQGDILQVAESRLIQDRFRRFLTGRSSPGDRRDLEEWMERFREGEGYARVVLFDALGQPRLTVPSRTALAVPPDLGRRVAAALARGQAHPMDLQQDLGAGSADFSLWAPVGRGPGAAAGALLFQVEAQPFLARVLGPWPHALPSAEVLLIGRDREEVVTIGGARHPREAVWSRRSASADHPGTLVSLALGGREGAVAGTDPRGNRVVGILKQVAGTPWALVSKVDEVEAAGPMRRKAWAGGLVLLGLVALAAAGTGLVVRHQDAGRILVRLAAERDRKALAERSEHLMRMAHDIILLTDLEGRILETNLAASERFGYSPEEFRRLALIDLRRPEFSAQLRERFENVKRAGSACFESLYLCKDGTEFAAEMSIRVIELGGTSYVLHFARDITERRRVAEERRQMEARLNQAQRLESLGSLAGGVAHDMNNVLGAILSLASAHREALPADSPMARSLDTITTACLRGRGVVRSLLCFARKDLDETRLLDLNQLVRDVVQLLGFTTLKRIRLEMDLAEPLAPVQGDGGALSHALMNLAVNALDAMPGQGTLRLRTESLPGDRVRVTVQDTGQGMTPEVLARAVEPFFTTKPAGKGTGLGLAMVFGTLKAHGGELDLASRPGEGTTATLTFPAQGPPPAGPEPVPAPGRGGAGYTRRILVVDDDELIRDSLVPMLRILGHTAQAAPGGMEALALLEGGLDPDLVILDMNMPGLNGAETLTRIRARRPRQRVLLATGYSDSDINDLVNGHPGVHCIQKPFSMSELRSQLALLNA